MHRWGVLSFDKISKYLSLNFTDCFEEFMRKPFEHSGDVPSKVEQPGQDRAGFAYIGNTMTHSMTHNDLRVCLLMQQI